jgi:hypothetical protein
MKESHLDSLQTIFNLTLIETEIENDQPTTKYLNLNDLDYSLSFHQFLVNTSERFEYNEEESEKDSFDQQEHDFPHKLIVSLEDRKEVWCVEEKERERFEDMKCFHFLNQDWQWETMERETSMKMSQLSQIHHPLKSVNKCSD